ncbi:MAG: hypothetical protein OXF72_06810 [Gammaproteobacteria bacterium]|nr:hypothetical protein [Gammaproteobacteria bacterium]MCY4276969.1 hypothetical protein [Gammaproteobacteria bacterium]
MSVMTIGCSDNSSLQVDWPKTFAAWCTTVSLTFIVLLLFDDQDRNSAILGILVIGIPATLVATLFMAVTHLTLHKIGCVRLSHYVFGYLVIVLPMLLNAHFHYTFPSSGWMLRASIVLSPALLVFWFLYFHVFHKHSETSRQAGSIAQPVGYAWSSEVIFGGLLSAGIAALIVFVLCFVFRNLLGVFTSLGDHHPVALWNGWLASLVVVVWGTFAHFFLLKLGRTQLINYAWAFAAFAVSFASLDVGVRVAATFILVLSLILPGGEVAFAESVTAVAESFVRLFKAGLFPTLVFLAGPVLWWSYHVAVPRIFPARPNA